MLVPQYFWHNNPTHQSENFQVQELSQTRLDLAQIQSWRMNILCIDPIRQHLYIANRNKIVCYGLCGLDIRSNRNVILPLYEPEDRINQIKISQGLEKEYLVAVTMEARVYIYDLNALHLKPLVLNNTYKDIADCSTWSLDIYQGGGKVLLAVGSNAKIISIWNISNLDFEKINNAHRESEQLQMKGCSVKTEYKIYEKNTDLIPTRYVKIPLQIKQLWDCGHNIPCVSFSPCGQFVASVSIDKYMRIHSVDTGKLINKVSLDAWGWSVLWIKKNENLETSKLEDYRLVATSAKEIFLIDVKKDRPEISSRTLILYSNRARYCVVEYIPELKLIVAIGQFSHVIDTLSINGNTLERENIDQLSIDTELWGGCVLRMRSQEMAILLAIDISGRIFIRKIVRKGFQNLNWDL